MSLFVYRINGGKFILLGL